MGIKEKDQPVTLSFLYSQMVDWVDLQENWKNKYAFSWSSELDINSETFW